MTSDNSNLCPNGCGEPGPHYVPPSVGDAGFYACKPLTPPVVPEAPYPVCRLMGVASRVFRMYPDPLLTTPSTPVTAADAAVMDDEFVREMQVLCANRRGYAVAGPQVGMLRRFFVMVAHPDLRAPDAPDAPDVPALWINPAVVKESPEQSYLPEGCLSIIARKNRKRFANLSRPTAVLVEHGMPGARITTECSGLLGRVVQHEIDHLDGVLFFTRLSVIERPKIDIVLREMRTGAVQQ